MCLRHLCNGTNYLCFTTEVFKKSYPFKNLLPSSSYPIIQVENAGTSFQHFMWGGDRASHNLLQVMTGLFFYVPCEIPCACPK